MNATSLDELRAAQAAALTPDDPASDDKMEQIRQLLFGDGLERLATLEASHREFETTVLNRLDLLSQRLDALARDVRADRQSAFDELSRAVLELGNRVRGL
jgi:hypothetical protein